MKNQFRKRFEAKFRGSDMTCIRAQEFLILTQGTDLVKEYSNKVNHLARYTLEITNTKIGRMEKFMYGFNLAMTQDVMTDTKPPQTYSEALNRALRANIFVKRMYDQTPTQLALLSVSVTMLQLGSNTAQLRGVLS